MKRVMFLILLILAFMPFVAHAQDDDDCDANVLTDWLIQRQVGLFRLGELSSMDILDNAAMLRTLIEVRRDFDSLQRPLCADDLYTLTRDYYIHLTDSYTYHVLGEEEVAQAIMEADVPRYVETVDDVYSALEVQVGEVDITQEANLIFAQNNRNIENDLHFSGDGDMELTGFEIPTGIYTITATLDDVFGMEVIPVSGSCDQGLIFDNLAEGEGYKVTVAFSSQGCLVDITVLANAPYSITFEKVDVFVDPY